MCGLYIEKFANDLAFSEECDIICTKVTIPNLLRAIGIELRDQYDSLGEKIVDYMELVRAYDRDKLFVTVNLRSFLSDRDAEELCKTVLSHGFHLLMLESHAYERLSCEARTVIDADLCEF